MYSLLKITLIAFVANTAIGAESPIPGYGVDVLQWEVEVSPGQIEILNGTVQEVYKQAVEINPDYQLVDAPVDITTRDLDKRDNYCGNWPLASKRRIEEGIRYLRQKGGRPLNGPGPKTCSRVSCSYNAGIWWCNDNTDPIAIRNFGQIADSTQNIINSCAPVADRVSGQRFESGKWNTIVRGDNC